MRTSRVKVAGLLAIAMAAVLGCRKPEEFPVEPVITFRSFTQYQDSASFVIGFTDGDGDVGLDGGDNQPPFDTGSTYYHNLFLDYDELRNGVWTRVDFALPLYYRIPRITPTGQNKALEGEIAVALKPWPIVPGNPFDTVRISARLVDRALHTSNTVVSDPVKVAP